MKSHLYFFYLILVVAGIIHDLTAKSAAADFPAVQITSSLTPDQGDLNIIPFPQPVLWKGADDKQTTLTLIIRVSDIDPPADYNMLQRLTLLSYSPNKWTGISKVRLEGLAGDGTISLLSEQDWYQPTEDNSNKTHTLTITSEQQKFPEYRLTLWRPHKFIHIRLDSLELIFANRIVATIKPVWQMFRADQPVRGHISFTNTAVPLQGKLILLNVDNNTSVWDSVVNIPAGDSGVDWQIPPQAEGTLRLQTSLELTSAVAVTTPVSEVIILPKRSQYWLPIGTAHGSAQSAALGFNVRHDWRNAAQLSEKDLSQGLLDTGLTRSNCNLTFETAEDGRFMVDAEGNTLKRLAFHVQRWLDKNNAALWQGLDNHPGLSEIVYYNEHGYHTWSTKGNADYSVHTLAFYQQWLQQQYGEIAKLNELYNTDYVSFADVKAPRQYQQASAEWFDWMEFRRVSVATYFNEAYQLLKPNFPNTPITPKPINFDYYTVSTATDPWLFRDSCDVYGYDVYPFQREGYLDPVMSLDYHRTQVGDKNLQFLESNFEFRRANQTEKLDSDMHLLYMPAFLHGLRGVYFYCWYQSWTDNHQGFWLRQRDGVLTPQGRGATQVAKTALTLAPVLVTGKVLPASVAVYFPWEEISQTPNVAPIQALRGAYKLLTQLHYAVDIISHHNILAGQLSNYKVLVLPQAVHLRPEVAAAVRDFVAKGGILIADYRAGKYDQYHRQADLLTDVTGVKSLDTTDKYTAFNYGDDKDIKLHKPITKETPFGWRHAPNIRPIDRAEIIESVESATILGQFADATPAIVRHDYGQGQVLYFAATFFNSYRPYFYTLNTLPNPATRGQEIVNVGDRRYRKIIQDFLNRAEIKPEIRLNLYSDDVEDDDSPFMILSRFASKDCVLFGLVNWGPHERNQVQFQADLPFTQVNRLLLIDTLRETIEELPFTEENGVLSAIIPCLGKSLILAAVKDSAFPLLTAAQRSENAAVEVRVENLLNEKIDGKLELRVDGVSKPLSAEIDCQLAIGEVRTFTLSPDLEFDLALLRDNRQMRLPWYVWLVYDGDAKAFARVHPNPDSFSAP